MKTTLIALALCLFTGTASANWFALEGEITVGVENCNGVPCHVAAFRARNNSSNASMRCKGYVYGKDQTGVVVDVWVNRVFGPGQWVEGYVYAKSPRYFVEAWSDIKCLL